MPVPLHLQFSLPERANLGEAFNQLREQIPGLEAVATARGVVFLCPLDDESRRLLQDRVAPVKYDGAYESFARAHYGKHCLLEWLKVGGPNDSDKVRIKFRTENPLSFLDFIISTHELNDMCADIGLMKNPNYTRRDPGQHPEAVVMNYAFWKQSKNAERPSQK
jgi:hypothetical protein